jgi:hypothetical protein
MNPPVHNDTSQFTRPRSPRARCSVRRDDHHRRFREYPIRESPDRIALALARRLVELHGGTIDARSDGHNQGGEFNLRLPVTSARSAAGA